MKYDIRSKTKVNDGDIVEFINSVTDIEKREDLKTLVNLFQEVTEHYPKTWGSSIIGFGKYKHTSSNKKENEWMRTGFSLRKNALTIYIMPGYGFDSMKGLLGKLGKHSLGKSCLYIKKLADVDLEILKEIIKKVCN